MKLKNRGIMTDYNKVRYPLVYVVIVNWNGLDDTLECLSSLKKIDYPNYEIVVVDNGSKNAEADRIKEAFSDIELIKNNCNTGFVFANNQGIELALQNNGDYVLLLNNDTVVKEDFLSKLINHAETDKKVGIVGPLIKYYKSNKIWFAGGWISYLTGLSGHYWKGKDFEDYTEKNLYEVDYITGCALLVKKEVINEIGLLDPVYFAYYEEADWCFRAKRAGFRIEMVPNSMIEHKKSASAGDRGSNKISPTQAYLWARNGIIFGKKNLEGVSRFTFLLGQFTLRLAFNLINCRDAQAAKQYFKGLRDGIEYT
jgi:hypothetical protein